VSFFESIAARVRAKNEAARAPAQDAYLELLQQLYESGGEEGESQDPDAVLGVLGAANKTCEAFEADFARYRELRQLQAKLADRERVEAELAAAVKSRNEAVAERERRVRELEDAVATYAVEERQLNVELERLGRAEERCYTLQGLNELEAASAKRGKPFDRFALQEASGQLGHLRWAFFREEGCA